MKDDDCWPSDEAVPRMLKILKENNYPHRVESKIYEKGSHMLTDGMEVVKGIEKLAFCVIKEESKAQVSIFSVRYFKRWPHK